MAQAVRAYRQSAIPQYAPERRFSHVDVRTVRTTGAPAPSSDVRSSFVVLLGKLAAIVLVVVAILSFARIALTNAAVATLIEGDEISAQISEARSSGVELEMQQSVLASPNALNSAVKRLNMVAPYEIGTIVLSPDIVAYDANGTLSLSESVQNAVAAHG